MGRAQRSAGTAKLPVRESIEVNTRIPIEKAGIPEASAKGAFGVGDGARREHRNSQEIEQRDHPKNRRSDSRPTKSQFQ